MLWPIREHLASSLHLDLLMSSYSFEAADSFCMEALIMQLQQRRPATASRLCPSAGSDVYISDSKRPQPACRALSSA